MNNLKTEMTNKQKTILVWLVKLLEVSRGCSLQLKTDSFVSYKLALELFQNYESFIVLKKKF